MSEQQPNTTKKEGEGKRKKPDKWAQLFRSTRNVILVQKAIRAFLAKRKVKFQSFVQAWEALEKQEERELRQSAKSFSNLRCVFLTLGARKGLARFDYTTSV